MEHLINVKITRLTGFDTCIMPDCVSNAYLLWECRINDYKRVHKCQPIASSAIMWTTCLSTVGVWITLFHRLCVDISRLRVVAQERRRVRQSLYWFPSPLYSSLDWFIASLFGHRLNILSWYLAIPLVILKCKILCFRSIWMPLLLRILTSIFR